MPAKTPDKSEEMPKVEEEFFTEKAHGGAESEADSTARNGSPNVDDDIDKADPELMRLPRRRGRHPVIAVLVVLLGGYLMYFVRADLIYFLQSNTPTDLGHVSDHKEADPWQANRYVTLNGAPDRKHSLLLEGTVSGQERLFRLLQSRSRVYVRKERRYGSDDREVTTVHTGRLVRFADQPYFKSVSTYYAKTRTSAHDLSFENLAKGLALSKSTGKPAVVTDADGVSVKIDADKQVWINVTYPNEWIIQFAQSAYASPADAEKLVTPLGIPYSRDEEGSKMYWRFVVHFPDSQITSIIKKFGAPALRAGVVRRQISYIARWDQLKIEDGSLVINAADARFPARYVEGDAPNTLKATRPRPPQIAKNAIRYVTVGSRFEIPADAMLILSDEKPESYWYYSVLYGVLLFFLLFNLYALVQRLRLTVRS
jgi:hypothetical protein